MREDLEKMSYIWDTSTYSKIFAEEIHISGNIPSLTIYRFKDSEGNTKTVPGRKGLIKFYDVNREMLTQGYEKESVSHKDGKNKLVEEKKKNFSTMNVTLAGAYKSIQDGYKVEAIRTLKANGENAQIAWNSELDVWIFCSKNVAMLVKTREDFDKYAVSPDNMRYSFSRLIGEAWFDKLDEIQDPAVLEELKKDLDGKTLVGEYVGNPDFLHLIFYPKVRILFYTVVDNNSDCTCMLPEESFNLFKKYNLECVTFTSLGLFSVYEDMMDTLRETYCSVARESISEGEEGSVIYFVRRSETGAEDNVLSLAKVKTLEYRMFRKLREKLKGVISKTRKTGGPGTSEKQIFNGMIKKFSSEAKELTNNIGGGDPILDKSELGHYIEVAQLAAKKCLDFPEFRDTAMNSYLVFLRDLLEGKLSN